VGSLVIGSLGLGSVVGSVVGSLGLGSVVVGSVLGLGSLELGSLGPAGLSGEVVGEPAGGGSLVPGAGAPLCDAVCVDVGTTGGASPRIATISAWNASSWVEISTSENAVMVFPNSANLFQTSLSASSCSSPGVSFTESTSWLASAAVTQR
jgi:hypothetical protein